MTLLAWLHQQRIGRTKELLETTNLNVQEIATPSRARSPANLRVHFRRATSISPTRHRQAFREADWGHPHARPASGRSADWVRALVGG